MSNSVYLELDGMDGVCIRVAEETWRIGSVVEASGRTWAWAGLVGFWGMWVQRSLGRIIEIAGLPWKEKKKGEKKRHFSFRNPINFDVFCGWTHRVFEWPASSGFLELAGEHRGLDRFDCSFGNLHDYWICLESTLWPLNYLSPQGKMISVEIYLVKIDAACSLGVSQYFVLLGCGSRKCGLQSHLADYGESVMSDH